MSDQEIIVDLEDAAGAGYVAPDEVFTDETERDACKNWVIAEIDRALAEREEREVMWARWRRQRLARPKNKVADYPWTGASNVVPPESMSVTNTAFAQFKGKYLNIDPLWAVKTTKEGFGDQSRSIEKLLNYCATNEDQMNIRKHNNTIFYDAVSLGTQFGKILWDEDKVKYKRNGEEITIVTHDGPNFRPIRLEDFICRANVTDLQKAAMYTVKTTYAEHELQAEAQSGYFVRIDDVIGSPRTEIDDNKTAEKNMLGDSPDVGTSAEYLIYEVAVFWDVDQDGTKEDLNLWIDATTGIVIREEYNELGFRDVQRFPYLTVPYELYGLGIGWMTDQMQEELTTLHNMAINSQHLSSLQAIITRPGTEIDSEELSPACIIETASPNEDVKILQFPDITASAVRLEALAKEYITRATGVSSAMAGMPDQTMKSRFSPTGYQQQAQQGANLLDLSSKNFDEAYSELGKMLFYLLLAYKEQTIESILPRLPLEDQENIKAVFAMGDQDIRDIFAFSVRVTPMDATEDAKQQKVMMLTQIYAAYIQQVIGLVMQMSSPEIPPNVKEILSRFIVGLTEMMQGTIEDMSDLSAQLMTPYVEDLKLMLIQMDMQKDAQVAQAKQSGGAGGVEQGNQTAMGAGQAGPTGQAGAEMASEGTADPNAGAPTGASGAGTGSAGSIPVFG